MDVAISAALVIILILAGAAVRMVISVRRATQVKAERDALRKEQETRRRMDNAARDPLDLDASRDWLRDFAQGDARPRK